MVDYLKKQSNVIRFEAPKGGKLIIKGCTFEAKTMKTGGIGKGETRISNTVMKSEGTNMASSRDGKMNIKGNASITQT